MKFLEIAKKLNEKHKDKIVLIKSGIFIVAVGKSTIAFADLFSLKRICMTYGICKAGIPVKKVEEYVKELCEMSVPFVMYEYTSKTNTHQKQYTKLLETEGINKVNITKNCIDCENCESYTNFKNSIDLNNDDIMLKLKNAIDVENYKEQQINFFGDEDE